MIWFASRIDWYTVRNHPVFQWCFVLVYSLSSSISSLSSDASQFCSSHVHSLSILPIATKITQGTGKCLTSFLNIFSDSYFSFISYTFFFFARSFTRLSSLCNTFMRSFSIFFSRGYRLSNSSSYSCSLVTPLLAALKGNKNIYQKVQTIFSSSDGGIGTRSLSSAIGERGHLYTIYLLVIVTLVI